MKEIIVIPTFYRQVKFYLRLSESMIDLGYDFKFFVYKLSLYLILKKRGANVFFIKKRDVDKDFIIDNKIIKETVEYKSKQMSLLQGEILYRATYSLLEKKVDKKNIYAMFIWNGSTIDQKAASFFAQKYNIKTLYFEIANIPGKIFIDKRGTNAQSEIYSNIKILDKYSFDESIYEKWKSIYLKNKLKSHEIPQKRSVISDIQIRFLIDLLGSIFITRIGFNKNFMIYKIKQLINNVMYPLKYDSYDYKNKKYIFFPLQVSYDSQIVLNSSINLLEAFKMVLDYAKKNNYDLVVKPHPQECNYSALVEFLKYKNEFILLNDNTFLLMKYAEEVWTINSTVGLEALIMGKKINVLGKAIYKNFSDKYLIKYILSYLIDIDFFGEEDISIQDIKILLERLK